MDLHSHKTMNNFQCGQHHIALTSRPIEEWDVAIQAYKNDTTHAIVTGFTCVRTRTVPNSIHKADVQIPAGFMCLSAQHELVVTINNK